MQGAPGGYSSGQHNNIQQGARSMPTANPQDGGHPQQAGAPQPSQQSQTNIHPPVGQPPQQPQGYGTYRPAPIQAAPQTHIPQPYASQPQAPQSYAPQSHIPQSHAPQAYAPQFPHGPQGMSTQAQQNPMARGGNGQVQQNSMIQGGNANYPQPMASAVPSQAYVPRPPSTAYPSMTPLNGSVAAPQLAQTTQIQPSQSQPLKQQPQLPIPPQPVASLSPPPTHVGGRLMDPSMSIAPPQPQPIEYLTNQMQNLSTNQPSLMGQPVGIIGQPLPLKEIYESGPKPPTLPLLNPEYMRITLPKIPKTAAILLKTKLPFGLTITPYPVGIPNESVPIIDGPIVRCRRCRTYLNPFVEMIDNGSKWRFPPNYDYDATAQRYLDRTLRSELQKPVYEFVAPMEYMARPPQPPVFLFLLDVSYHAVQAGVLPSAARIILDALDGLPNTHDRTKVGIMTVDSTVHFYRLALGEEEPRMLVLSDFEGEPFLPCPEDLLVSLTDGRAQLVRVLRKIATLFQETQCADSALGPALAAAVKLLSPMGGKLVVIQASLPTIGEGKIPANRNDPTALSTTKENALMQPANGFYKTLATECIRCQICIDLFLFPSPHIDVATIGCAAKYTGGKIFLYPEFSASNIESVEKLAGEMSDHLKADVGLEAVIRIRASQGVSLGSYHGSFFLRSTDLLALPNVNARHSYSAQVTIEENINSRLLCFQTAVLYTSCAGERRIRVINAAYPVTDDHREVVLHADCGALGDLLMKMAAEKALSSRLEDARDALLNKLHDILAAIRALFQTGQNPQLLLTENLRLLPLMILGILKSTAIRGSKAANSLDMRAYMLALVKTLSVSDSLYLLHPYLCAIHAMTDEYGIPAADGSISLPPPIRLGSDMIERHGLYLLDNGCDFYLYVGSQIHPELVQLIFGCPYASIRMTLPNLDNSWSRRLMAIMSTLRTRHGNCPSITVIREDSVETLKDLLTSQLVEDKSADQPSYAAWAAALRDKIYANGR